MFSLVQPIGSESLKVSNLRVCVSPRYLRPPLFSLKIRVVCSLSIHLSRYLSRFFSW